MRPPQPSHLWTFMSYTCEALQFSHDNRSEIQILNSRPSFRNPRILNRHSVIRNTNNARFLATLKTFACLNICGNFPKSSHI